MRIRVGLMNPGEAWETRHRAALRSLVDRFEVRAVCSDVAQRAEQVACEFNAETTNGFRTLAQRTDVDAVLMLSANWYGALPILAACEAGKAIYCASMPEIDPDQAQDVQNRVESSGVAFMSELPRRYAPATLRLKELLATQLGPPKLLFCHSRHARESGASVVRPSEIPVRPISRDLFELVDWCRYVAGYEPTSVWSVRHRDEGTCRYEMMSLDFSPEDAPGTRTTAQISCGRYIPQSWHEAITFRPPAALQVACAHGVAFVDLPSTLIWFDDAGRHMESLESERPVGEQLLTQFYRAVTSLVRQTSDLHDVHRTLQILKAVETSWKQGCRVKLGEE